MDEPWAWGRVCVEVQFSHYFLWLPAMAICAAAKYWRATGARAPAHQHHQVHHHSAKVGSMSWAPVQPSFLSLD